MCDDCVFGVVILVIYPVRSHEVQLCERQVKINTSTTTLIVCLDNFEFETRLISRNRIDFFIELSSGRSVMSTYECLLFHI